MIANKKFALVFRFAGLIMAISGIIATSVKPDVGFTFSSFRYYTIQSNLLAAVLFAILTYKTIRSLKNDKESASFYPRFEMVCVVDLLLTLVVYWALLAPSSFTMGTSTALFTFKNLSVHLVTPLLCLIDYILFAESGKLKYLDVYKVIIYPLFYVASSSVMGLMGHVYRLHGVDGLPVRFPYFFFDYDRIGWFSVVYIVGLIVVFLIISHVFYFFDKKVKKKIILR